MKNNLIIKEKIDINNIGKKNLYHVRYVPYGEDYEDYSEKISIESISSNYIFHECLIFGIKCYIKDYNFQDSNLMNFCYYEYYFTSSRSCERYIDFRNYYQEIQSLKRTFSFLEQGDCKDKKFLKFLKQEVLKFC